MKRTMTLNLSSAEMDALKSLAEEKGLSKTGVLRMALRLYQAVVLRTAQGERLFFEDERAKKKAEVMVI